MVRGDNVEPDNFVGDTLASLGVGIWSWHGSPDYVHCCPVAARLFGVPTAEAWNGLPLDRFAANVHPEDRARFIDLIAQARQTGGAFVAEYRTLDAAGKAHSVLDRGEFELGPEGFAVAARGLIFDMTDRPRGLEVEHGMSGVPNFADLPPLHQAVEHGLALHKLLGVIPEGKRQIADTLLKAVLEILGKEIAASLKHAGSRRERGNIH